MPSGVTGTCVYKPGVWTVDLGHPAGYCNTAGQSNIPAQNEGDKADRSSQPCTFDCDVPN